VRSQTYTVTFLALERHRSSTSSKLRCLVTEAGMRKWLVQGRTWQRRGWHSYRVLRLLTFCKAE